MIRKTSCPSCKAALAAFVVAAAIPTFLSARQDDDAAARKARIRAALRTASFDDARLEAERLKQDSPAEPETLTLYGDALWASGLFDEAEAAYTDALMRDPGSARARYGVARGLAARSHTADALDAVMAALAAAPDDPDVHGLAAGLYERLRRFPDAADEYQRYAALTPDDPTAGGTALARATFLRSFERREPLSMKAKDRAPFYTVPFKLVQNKVVVQGRINGSRVEWVLDTGAEHTGISAETAMRTGVRPVATTLTAGVGEARLRRIQLARIDTLEVGRLHLRNVPVSIRTPAVGGAPRWQHESLSPVGLGLSAVIDYRRREVTFAERLDDEAAPGTDHGTAPRPKTSACRCACSACRSCAAF
jgi:tetratricopeptide (TPR) repeat protein